MRREASISVELLPDGRWKLSSTMGGTFDAGYAPLTAERLPGEVIKLLAELCQQLQSSGEAVTE